MTQRMSMLAVLALLTGCGGGGASQQAVSVTAGAAMDLRSKVLVNEAAYIPAMCWTKTEDDAGKIHNPCFSCHTVSTEPNYRNDYDLQLEFSFPEYARTNRWTNLFKSRSAQVASISDADMTAYVRTSNYLNKDGGIITAAILKTVPTGWDFNGNGIWDGYMPDTYLSFDSEGFDRTPDGSYTGWRAFGYYPFLGTFWPTNGSTDDVMIRLSAPFRTNSAGQFDRTVYKVNLAIVEALIKRSNVPIAPVDERTFGVDLDKDGALGVASRITYDWAPAAGRYMSYVGQAEAARQAGTIHLAAGLFPEGTEFLHSVRYIDVTDSGTIALAPHMKELRYARKTSWQTYADLEMAALAAAKEKDTVPDRLETFVGNVEQGISNGQGWMYQGFIEDSGGDLRPQTFEETVFCMGCHSGLGVTTDGIFSFPRKFSAAGFQQGWYHWTQQGLTGIPEQQVSVAGQGIKYEYSWYLLMNGAGDELRGNDEILTKFFANGALRTDMTSQLHSDVTVLLNPSPQRAMILNKAYRTIVKEQSFVYGRDAVLEPVTTVHKNIQEGQLTKVAAPVQMTPVLQ